jgi:hypothetical protein
LIAILPSWTAKMDPFFFFGTPILPTPLRIVSRPLSILSRQNPSASAVEGLAAVVNRVTCSVFGLGLIFYVHSCHPRGALPAHWACRMFSGL